MKPHPFFARVRTHIKKGEGFNRMVSAAILIFLKPSPADISGLKITGHFFSFVFCGSIHCMIDGCAFIGC